MIASFATIKIRALSRLALHTIFKVRTKVSNDFIKKTFLVNNNGYPAKSDMTCSTVQENNLLLHNPTSLGTSTHFEELLILTY